MWLITLRLKKVVFWVDSTEMFLRRLCAWTWKDSISGVFSFPLRTYWAPSLRGVAWGCSRWGRSGNWWFYRDRCGSVWTYCFAFDFRGTSSLVLDQACRRAVRLCGWWCVRWYVGRRSSRWVRSSTFRRDSARTRSISRECPSTARRFSSTSMRFHTSRVSGEKALARRHWASRGIARDSITPSESFRANTLALSSGSRSFTSL